MVQARELASLWVSLPDGRPSVAVGVRPYLGAVDALALATIASGAALGLGGIVATVLAGERRLKFDAVENAKRRSHERQLAHDERIRDDRVKLYVRLLTEAERVSRDIRARYRVGGREAPVKESDAIPDHDLLDALAAELLAFASDSVGDAWTAYTEALKRFRLDPATTLAHLPAEAPREQIAEQLGSVALADPTIAKQRLEMLWADIDANHQRLITAVRDETARGGDRPPLPPAQ